MNTSSQSERVSLDCLEAMIRELDKLSRELAAAFEQVLRADSGPPDDVARLEKHVAELIVGFQRQREGVFAEAQRQGRGSRDLDAIFARCVGALPPVDFQLSQDSSGTGSELTRWHGSAGAGRADAQVVLGFVLLGALGHEPNEAEAVKQFVGAAEQGHPAALFEVAGFLHEGRVLPKDERKSREMLQKAADAGFTDANYVLALGHLSGIGVDPDSNAAVLLLTNAAQDGHAEAQLELGRIFAIGQLGEIDHSAAVKWLSMAKSQHRAAAVDWIEKYRDLSSDEYRSAIWLDAWGPDAQLLPGRSGVIGKLMSFGVLAIIIVASLKGNSLGLFLLLLFVTVLAHEAGHLLAGRFVGIPIRVFCAGIGPLVWSFRSRARRLPTRFDIRLVPLMGYVEGYVIPRCVWNYWRDCWKAEDAGEPVPVLPRFDTNEPPVNVAMLVARPRRIAYYLGGVVVNLFLAVVCLWAYENYTDSGRSVLAPIAGRVPTDSVAESVGLQEGDRFVSIDGEKVARGFREVQDRLIPVDHPIPPEGRRGATISLIVRRADRELTLTWPLAAQRLEEEEADRIGLHPPESWSIDNVHPSASDRLRIGDVIRSFQAQGGHFSTDEAGAHEALRRTFAEGNGNPVSLVIDRPAESKARRVSVSPSRANAMSDAREARYEHPFELAPLREPGPPTPLGQVIARLVSFGLQLVTEIPRETVASVVRNPTEEEKGRLVRLVKRDPWSILLIFALVNMAVFFFNLLPVPPLDGFHIACSVIEIVIRRELPARAISMLMYLGWLLLAAWLLLNAFVIVKDLVGTIL